jgi:hypothetical protein
MKISLDEPQSLNPQLSEGVFHPNVIPMEGLLNAQVTILWIPSGKCERR